MLHYSAVTRFICFLTHPFMNQDYHDIDLDKKFNYKEGNRNDSQKISGKLFFFLKMAYDESLYEDIWP